MTSWLKGSGRSSEGYALVVATQPPCITMARRMPPPRHFYPPPYTCDADRWRRLRRRSKRRRSGNGTKRLRKRGTDLDEHLIATRKTS